MHTAHDPDLGEDEEEAQAAHEGPPEIHLLSMELAMNVYDSIKQRGSLISPWTGFSVRTLTDEEIAAFPLASNRVRCGIGIEHVWEGGPAEALGIHKDDILFKMSHYPICTVANFQRWLYLYGVGTPVKLYFVRRAPEGDKLITVSYTIEERPKWAKPR
jgi:S1-C subfamily serine protease